MSEFASIFLDDPDMKEVITLTRIDGQAATNVPHLIASHSPTGYEWGYGGSGPADLALNIVENILRQMGFVGEKTKAWDGRKMFVASWLIHQSFKWNFIASMAANGGTIDYKEAKEFVEYRLEEVGGELGLG